MGNGKGLAFLNKKTWHTGSLQMIERVWKAEQKQKEEQKKLEELQKQIKEERKLEEVQRLAEDAGQAPKRQEKVDFLYDAGLARKMNDDAYLLGKAWEGPEDEKLKEQNSLSKGRATTTIDKAVTTMSAAQSKNDAWTKLHSDPLFAIRQQEINARRKITSNPVKMEAIRAQIKALGHQENLKKEKKRMKKEAKRMKKEAKRMKKEKGSRGKGSTDSSGDEGEAEQGRISSKAQDKSTAVLDAASSQRNQDTYGLTFASSESKGIAEQRLQEKRESGKSSLDLDQPAEKELTPEEYFALKRQRMRERHRARDKRVSEEDRRKRLEDMSRDASWHDEQRYKRIKRENERDEKETEVGGDGSKYMAKARDALYGRESSSISLEERVRSRAHFNERNSNSMSSNAFRR